MKYSTLRQTHPSYDAKYWARQSALYNAGKAFKEHVATFLPPNPMEPRDRYQARLAVAERAYEPHVSNVIDQACNQLFAFPMQIRLQGADSLPDYYAGFKESCTRDGLDLQDFAKERLTTALVKGAAYWLVELPSPEVEPTSLADWQDQKLGEGWLTRVDPEALLDWECDESGALIWAVIHDKRCQRPSPADTRTEIVETFRVYDRTNVETFQARYVEGKPPKDKDEVPRIASRAHGFGQVPLVGLVLPPALSMMERAGPLQLQHFDLKMALYWATKQTCYAMPVHKRSAEDGKELTFGAGYYIEIGTGDDLSWAQPDGATFEVQLNQLKSIKEEIYRVCNATALGIDNSAASIGRSGESKAVDVAISEGGLKGYGDRVREQFQRTLNMLAAARGEGFAFDVAGLDRFAIQNRGLTVEEAQATINLGIHSETYRKELEAAVAIRTLSSLPAGVIAKIVNEIQAAKLDEPASNIQDVAPQTIPVETIKPTTNGTPKRAGKVRKS